MNITELIDVYCQAWSEDDLDHRTALLRSVWAPNATYTDPSVHVVGLLELHQHITKVRTKRPGSQVVRTSQVDLHHGVARFAWRAIEANGHALPEGLDIAFLSPDGNKIERIIGFFGPLQANTPDTPRFQ